jgi:DNA-binding response OmpR family regulator
LRVLLIEDEARIVELLSTALSRAGFVVDTFGTCADGGEALALTPYDAAILDLGLPDGDGLALLAAARSSGNDVPILVLTARDAVEDRVRGLDTGADDYLVKPFAMEELVARVDALLRRGRAITDTQRLQVGDLTLDLLRREAQRDGRIIELTAKEFALLEYLMRHPGQVLTRTQIIDHVWRYDSDALSNVVDIYIHYLRDKIDRASARPMIKTMRGVGYRIEP